MEFPDLSPATDGEAAWTLRVAPTDEAPPEGTLLGEKAVWNDTARAYRTDGWFRLDYPFVGSYTISSDGAKLVWYPMPGAAEELCRAVVLGPILALALHVGGTFCLHGSAVETQHGAIAFLAPKFFGKSTLALALTAAGARLITDDAVAVDLDPAVYVRPGVHSVRLHADAVDALDAASLPGRLVSGGKITVSDLDPSLLAWDDAPLAALYQLHPVADGDGHARVERVRLHGLQAVLAIVVHTKLGSELCGAAVAADHLRWAATLARNVPVYSLAVPRSYEMLGSVVDQLLEWHGGAAWAAAPAGAASPFGT